MHQKLRIVVSSLEFHITGISFPTNVPCYPGCGYTLGMGKACYRPNICSPPKFRDWSRNPQCDGIWRWDLWVVSRFRWGHYSGGPYNAIRVLITRGRQRLLSLFPCEHKEEVMCTHREEAARKQVLIKNRIFWHLAFVFPVSTIVRNKCLLCKWPSLWHFIIAAQLDYDKGVVIQWERGGVAFFLSRLHAHCGFCSLRLKTSSLLPPSVFCFLLFCFSLFLLPSWYPFLLSCPKSWWICLGWRGGRHFNIYFSPTPSTARNADICFLSSLFCISNQVVFVIFFLPVHKLHSRYIESHYIVLTCELLW